MSWSFLQDLLFPRRPRRRLERLPAGFARTKQSVGWDGLGALRGIATDGRCSGAASLLARRRGVADLFAPLRLAAKAHQIEDPGGTAPTATRVCRELEMVAFCWRFPRSAIARWCRTPSRDRVAYGPGRTLCTSSEFLGPARCGEDGLIRSAAYFERYLRGRKEEALAPIQRVGSGSHRDSRSCHYPCMGALLQVLQAGRCCFARRR